MANESADYRPGLHSFSNTSSSPEPETAADSSGHDRKAEICSRNALQVLGTVVIGITAAALLLTAVDWTQNYYEKSSSTAHSMIDSHSFSVGGSNQALYPSSPHSQLDIMPARDQSSTFRKLEDEEESGDNDSEDQEEDDESEDEGEQDDDGNGDDDDGAQQDDSNDDNGDQNQDRNEPGNDDFFDDFIQDDLVADDYAVEVTDDYYIFERDRTPHLLPMQPKYVVGFFIASLALSLGASGGTGGGGIIVPIYILILGLPIQVAIPIGAVTVFGGAIASTCLNWTRRHPLADRVLIDWDLILLLEPLALIGTLVGTLVHRMFSEKLLVVMLVLLLSITAHTTLSKAMRMYQAEIRYIRHLRAAQSEPPSGHSPTNQFPKNFPKIQAWGSIDPAESDSLANNHTGSKYAQGDKSRPPSSRHLEAAEKEEILILNPDFITLRSELIEQEKFTPRSKIIALCIMFNILTFLNIMVGGGAYQSPWDITCGSVAFWTVHVIMIAFLIAAAWAAQTYVVARHEVKELVRFDYVHGDIKWDTRSAIVYPTVFLTAGLFAGTLGIGGGIITVPIMLAMGVHPGVVTATSSAMILFTSASATTSFFVFGLILEDFAIAGFIIGFIATLIGQLMMRQVRQAKSASGRNFERNSYTAFAIGGVIAMSALLMTIEYVFTIVEEKEDQRGLCDGLRF